MSKFLKFLVVIALTVTLGLGSLVAFGGVYDSYKQGFNTGKWHLLLNAFIERVGSDITVLSNLITNWGNTVDSLTLIEAAPTYSDASTFILAGDYSALLTPGKRLVADCGADGLKPNTVVSCTYAAPNSTVVVTTANLTANLAAVSYYATRNGLNTYGSGDIVLAEFGAPSWVHLQAAAALANASGRRLLITPGTHPVSGDLTISTPVLLVPGAVLEIATTKTLTVNGSLDNGRYQIISCIGTGKVVFGAGAVKEVYPEWWGTPNLNNCLTSLPSGGNISINKPFNQTVTINVPVTTNDINWRIYGQDRWGSKITFTPIDGTHMFSIAGDSTHRVGLSLEHLQLYGNAASGDCIRATYMMEGRLRLIDVDIFNWGGYGVHATRCEGFYIDPTSYIRYCNQATGSYAGYFELCTGAKVDGLWKQNTKGVAHFNTCGGIDVGLRAETNNAANDTKWIKFENTTGNVHPYMEDSGDGQASFIETTGTTYGLLNFAGGAYTSHRTTRDVTKALFYFNSGMAINIAGNTLKASENNSVTNQPYAWVGATAQNIEFGRNSYAYLGNSGVTTPFIIDASADNIRFPFMVEKTYTFVLADVPANATTSMVLPGAGTAAYYYIPKKSWPVELTVQASTAVTAESIAVNFTKAGGTAALTTSLISTGPTTRTSISQSPFQADSMAAAGALTASVTTPAGFTPPGSLDLLVTVRMLEEDDYHP